MAENTTHLWRRGEQEVDLPVVLDGKTVKYVNILAYLGGTVRERERGKGERGRGEERERGRKGERGGREKERETVIEIYHGMTWYTMVSL